MKLNLKRIVIFTADVPGLAQFYETVMGLTVRSREIGWVEFDAGTCRLALHHGKSTVGKRSPKLVFFAADVSGVRAMLIKRGAGPIGEVQSTAHFDMCDGKDLDGNLYQISSRP
jgi:predicted enzyme related to lactoylglutathione lyase